MKITSMMDLHVDVGVPTSAGLGPFGRRVIYPITGGNFAGVERGGEFQGKPLKGQVLPTGSGDWVLITGEVSRLDIRLTLLTDDGWGIYMQASGVLVINDKVKQRLNDPDLITDFGDTYFMTHTRFETGEQTIHAGMANPYAWMSDCLAVGQGKLGPSFPGFMAAQWIEAKSFLLEN